MMPYLGLETPPAPLLTTSQKSFRTPDIDEVGLDGHHLTFFEMLGNFSFGQYFKEGAIEFAREFVLEHMRLDWERIWVTVHAGDPQLKLGPTRWRSSSGRAWACRWSGSCSCRQPRTSGRWAARDRAARTPRSTTTGEEHGCGEPDCAPACTRCARFLEFWNLVFMAYEQHADGTLTSLPKENIDTGLGRARRSDPPGRHVGLRDRRVPADDGGGLPPSPAWPTETRRLSAPHPLPTMGAG